MARTDSLLTLLALTPSIWSETKPKSKKTARLANTARTVFVAGVVLLVLSELAAEDEDTR